MCQKSPFPPNLPPVKLSGSYKNAQESLQERRITPQRRCPTAQKNLEQLPGIPGNEETPLDARIKIPGIVFHPFPIY